MEDSSELNRKESRRAAEDGVVLELMTQVRDLKEEIGHLKRKARRTRRAWKRRSREYGENTLYAGTGIGSAKPDSDGRDSDSAPH
jgi:hypothetical protein